MSSCIASELVVSCEGKVNPGYIDDSNLAFQICEVPIDSVVHLVGRSDYRPTELQSKAPSHSTSPADEDEASNSVCSLSNEPVAIIDKSTMVDARSVIVKPLEEGELCFISHQTANSEGSDQLTVSAANAPCRPQPDCTATEEVRAVNNDGYRDENSDYFCKILCAPALQEDARDEADRSIDAVKLQSDASTLVGNVASYSDHALIQSVKCVLEFSGSLQGSLPAQLEASHDHFEAACAQVGNDPHSATVDLPYPEDALSLRKTPNQIVASGITSNAGSVSKTRSLRTWFLHRILSRSLSSKKPASPKRKSSHGRNAESIRISTDSSLARMVEDSQLVLLDAAEKGDLDMLLASLAEGTDIDARDGHGQTPLILAAEKGHLHIVSELLRRNADQNARDEDGWAALIAASKEGYLDIVELMLENGAKVDLPDMGGWTPLVWASYKGHTEVVQELLCSGANPNERGQHNMTALIWAAGRGHAAVVKELISAGAAAEVADKYGTSALTWACRKGHFEVAKILLQHEANPDTSGTHGWTPLIMAAKGGYEDVVGLLFDHLPNINAVDQDGRSALSWASKEGYLTVVAKLLQKGAFLNMPDKLGETPIICAAKEGHAKVVRLLISQYADIEMKDAENKTALCYAAEKGHVEVVTELLNAGADTEITNKDGDTPLLCCARRKYTRCVKELVERGANACAVDKKGDTALHVAVRNRYAGICEVLLQDPKNAKLLYRPNKAGETPYNMDSQNQPPVLSSVFHAKQVALAMERKELPDRQDIIITTVADFIAEPSLAMPVTIAFFSRWATGKSPHVHRLTDLLEDYRMQEPAYTLPIRIAAIWLSLFVAVTVGLIIWVSVSWLSGLIVSLCLLSILLVILLLPRLAVLSSRGPLHDFGVFSERLLWRIGWLFQLVYCVPPSLEGIRPTLPVHLISVRLTRSVLIGDKPITSLVNLTKELSKAIEDDLGVLVPRLYRLFRTGPYHPRVSADASLKTRWKTSCCCIPSIVFTSFIAMCLWLGMVLFGVFGIRGPGAIIALQIAVCCIVGSALLANIFRFLVIMYSLVLSMRKRITILSTQPSIREETFLQVLKQELDLCVAMLSCLDGFIRRQTRVIITVDLLDSLEQEKSLRIMNSLKLLLSEPGHPFVVVFAVDPRLLVKAVSQSLLAVTGVSVVPDEYLKSVVDLPIYVFESSNLNLAGLIPSSLRNQIADFELSEPENEDAELEWDANGEVCIGNGIDEDCQNVLHVGNGDLPLLNNRVSKLKSSELRAVRFPSSTSLSQNCPLRPSAERADRFSPDLSSLFRSNENGSLSDIKRIMNIVWLAGRIMRASEVQFQWTRLAAWVSLSSGWPYKCSWLILLCMDASLNLPGGMLLKKLHDFAGHAIPLAGDPEVVTDSDATYFETILASRGASLTVKDVRDFARSSFYIDPSIMRQMMDWLVSAKGGATSKEPSLSQSVSVKETFPASPSSGQFTWLSAVEDGSLARMTVDDVCRQLSELEGVDPKMIAAYQTKLVENNVSGRVLLACDLYELRDVMQMRFGDWQLFKTWVLTCRSNEPSTSRGLIHSFSMPQSLLVREESVGDYGRCAASPASVRRKPGGSSDRSNITAVDESGRCSSRLGTVPSVGHSDLGFQRPPQPSPLQSGRSGERSHGKREQTFNSQDNDAVFQLSADSGFASTDLGPKSQLRRQNLTLEPKVALGIDVELSEVADRVADPHGGNACRSNRGDGRLASTTSHEPSGQRWFPNALEMASPGNEQIPSSKNFRKICEATSFALNQRTSSLSSRESDDLYDSTDTKALQNSDQVKKKADMDIMGGGKLSASLTRLHELHQNELVSSMPSNASPLSSETNVSGRACSLSELPLPPLSMLETYSDMPLPSLQEYLRPDQHAASDSESFPSPPSEARKRFSFRASRTRSSHAGSSEADACVDVNQQRVGFRRNFASDQGASRTVWEHHNSKSVFQEVATNHVVSRLHEMHATDSGRPTFIQALNDQNGRVQSPAKNR